MSYISQEERDFSQAERLAFALTIAFVLGFFWLKSETIFPTSDATTTTATEDRHGIQSAEAAMPQPTQPGKKRKQHIESIAPASSIPASAAPANPDDLVPQDVQAYIKKWAPTAVAEQRRTGVPASITLAQAIIESYAGKSGLALSANNHFGIKCHEKGKCKAGHCINFTDDIDLDYFMVYQNAYKSFRAHSDFLQRPRYQPIHGKDWRGWCTGLQRAGYATDPKYAVKLIRTIEKYELYQYDE